MSNKKITDLTELTTPTTDDVFPVVDIATNTTRKVQLGNLPTTSVVSSAIASKQDTLVSGTNIKTLNNTSLLGSGNINVVASPSGVAGAIQFSDGSAFASDATNLFWDDTNNRLGVGTNAPSATAHIVGANSLSSGYAVKVLNSSGGGILSVTNDGYTQIGDFTSQGFGTLLTFLRPAGGTRLTTFNQGNSNLVITNGIGNVTFQNTPVQIVGSGTTNATTSLLVQDSVATNLMSLRDDGVLLLFAGSKTGQLDIQGGDLSGVFAKAYNSQNDNIIRYKDYNGNIGMLLTMTGGGTGSLTVNNGSTSLGSTVGIKGSGSTSATTSLLVQNSAGTAALTVKDDLSTTLNGSLTIQRDATNFTMRLGNLGQINAYIDATQTNQFHLVDSTFSNTFTLNDVGISFGGSPTASAKVSVNSTTQGFLPPRMTTTQKNAIASPASGLVVYDSTTNKLCCYNGSTWNDLF